MSRATTSALYNATYNEATFVFAAVTAAVSTVVAASKAALSTAFARAKSWIAVPNSFAQPAALTRATEVLHHY